MISPTSRRALAAAAAIALSAGVWWLLRGRDAAAPAIATRTPGPAEATNAAEGRGGRRPPPRLRSAPQLASARDAALSPYDDDGDEPAEPGYPDTAAEGLAQDLAIMNAEQLRAELASIALSYPGVIVVGASCPTRPCRGELRAADPAELDRFLQMVRHRFQGHVRVTRRTSRDASGNPVTDVSVVVGG